MCTGNKRRKLSSVTPSNPTLQATASSVIARAASSSDVLLGETQPEKPRCSTEVILFGLFFTLLMPFYTGFTGIASIMSGYVFFLEVFENETEEALPIALNRTFNWPEPTASGVLSWSGIWFWTTVYAVFKAVFHFMNIYKGIQYLKKRFEYSTTEGWKFFGFLVLATAWSAAAGGMPAYVNLSGMMMLSYAIGAPISGDWTLAVTATAWVTSSCGNGFYYLLHAPAILTFLSRLLGDGYPAMLGKYQEEGDESRLMDRKRGEVPAKYYPRLGQAIPLYLVLAACTAWGYWYAYRVKGWLAPLSTLNLLKPDNYTIAAPTNATDFLAWYDEVIGNETGEFTPGNAGLQVIGILNVLSHFIRWSTMAISFIVVGLTSLNCLKKDIVMDSFLVGFMSLVIFAVMSVPDLGSVTEGFRKGESSIGDYLAVFAWLLTSTTDNIAKLFPAMMYILSGIKKCSNKRQQSSRCCGVSIYRVKNNKAVTDGLEEIGSDRYDELKA